MTTNNIQARGAGQTVVAEKPLVDGQAGNRNRKLAASAADRELLASDLVKIWAQPLYPKPWLKRLELLDEIQNRLKKVSLSS